MKLVELANIARKHTVLHYRRAFTATAIVDNGSNDPEEHALRFVVEHAPLGPTTITVEHLTDALSRITEEIQARVAELDAAGMLP